MAPPVGGTVMDIFTRNGQNPGGYVSLLFFAAFFFLLAIIIMTFVRRGEAQQADPVATA